MPIDFRRGDAARIVDFLTKDVELHGQHARAKFFDIH
jgi:hypothetical protein